MKGFTDKPVGGKAEDIFGVEKYIKGLSSFALDCATPMTVAVQGDWGSGKTSFMMLIKEEIESKVVPIWFNTWQFSQFNLGDQLPIMLISKLTAALNVTSGKGEEIKKSIAALGGFVLKVAISAVDKGSGLNVSGALENAKGKEQKDITDVVAKLKTQFQELVNVALEEQKKDRVVIFVDDLDRLQPARAVELLEVLKLFLDCDGCVFLLAIDYSVVSQGVRQKYGETLGEDKGRSFFDKIIQVPFKMPVAHYDVEKYVMSSLAQMEFSVIDVSPYVNLITTSIGYNPRGMKRLLNAFLLLQPIHADENLNEEYEKRLLFAVLCLQLSYEEVYNFIVRNSDRLVPEFFDQLADPKSYEAFLGQENDEDGATPADLDGLLGLFEEWDIQQLDIGKAVSFLGSFRAALVHRDDASLGESIQRLRDILNFSAITAAEPVAFKDAPISANNIVGKGVRYQNVLDETARWHSAGEPIVFDSVKKLPGWNNSILEAFRLFGEETPCSKYGDLLCKVLGKLYQRNPERFQEIRENAAKYKLSSLFNGTGGSIQTPAPIPGTAIVVETKTMSHQKVGDLKKMLQAMGYSPDDLQLLAKLANRAQRAEN